MQPHVTTGSTRGKMSLPIEWHESAWQPAIQFEDCPVIRQSGALIKPLPMPVLLPHPTRRKNQFKLMKKPFAGQRRFNAGFTLVELLTVIAIIAILAAMLLAVLAKAKVTAYKTQAKIQVNDIVTAIQAYDSAYGRFPVSAQAQAAAAVTNGDFTYGGYFQNTTGTPAPIGTPVNGGVLTNSEVIAILMDFTTFPNSTGSTVNTNNQKNPQKTLFLNAKMSGYNPSTAPPSSQPLPGVDNNLVYRDPWGNPYIISMDLNYDGQCGDAYYKQQLVSQNPPVPAPYTQTGFNGLYNPNTSQSDDYLFHGPVMVWSVGPDGKYDSVGTTGNGVPPNAGFNKDNILSWQ